MFERRPLHVLQAWVQEVITHPHGVVGGLQSAEAQDAIPVALSEVESVVSRSRSLDSISRLNVYANAYSARLVECLGEEFPAVRHALGEDTFTAFCFGYLQACPPTGYTLGELGRRFPEFLRDTRPVDIAPPAWPDFLIDVATLERTYAEVFDGPGIERSSRLDAARLLAVPAERIGDVVFQPAPCLRLLQLQFPAHEYITSVRCGYTAEIPLAVPTDLVVTRRDYVVRRGPVGASEFCILSSLVARQPLGVAIARAVERDNVDVEELVGQLSRWFEHWATAGWFTDFDLPECSGASFDDVTGEIH